MKFQKNPDVYCHVLADADALNAAIVRQFAHWVDAPEVRKSHRFEGRYENIYIGRERIPELQQILAIAETGARAILGLPADMALRSGCWFNQMGPGQRTLPHRHDDDDELLSAVYYVRVPANSGQLVLSDGRTHTTVEPQAGMFAFFRPDVEHEVTENLSTEERLSIGINIGPTGT